MSARRLSELASHLLRPDGIESSGFGRINRAAVKAGIRYDPWQQGFLWLLFARKADGKHACGTGGAVLSSCRQIGKTFTVGSAIFLHAVLTPGLKVIWTAHHSRTSDETFNDLCDMARTPTLRRYVSSIRRANGQQEIRFTNRSRIMFGARERGFGRGLHSVDVEIFDEAQILTVRALANMLPIVNTAPDPLVVFMGNPPKPGDQSEVFEDKRRAALAGGERAQGMMYVEFSADRDADPDDRAQWAKANPSYPERTGADAILRLRDTLPVDDFRREALGIWSETTAQSAIDPDDWKQCETDDPDTAGLLAFGVDMPPDRSTIVIGAAVRHEDDTVLVNIEQIRDTASAGIAWAAEWLAERWPRTCAVVIDAQSPAMSLLPDLQERHVRVMVTQSRDLGAATGRVLDMIRAHTLSHLPDGQQPQLDAAVQGATLRQMGPSGAVAWQKRGTDIDISPLQAVTLAVHGAFTSRRRPGRKAKAVAL